MNYKNNAEKFKIFNYGDSPIVLSTQNKGMLLEPMKDKIPSSISVYFEDLEYINSTTPAFRSGVVEFDPSQRKELFKALHIEDCEKTAFFQSELESNILHPTADFLIKVVNTVDMQTIGRIKGMVTGLINSHQYDISTRVQKVVSDRFTEIMEGKYKSDISIKKVSRINSENEDTDLRATIATLQAQIEALANAAGHAQVETKTAKEDVGEVSKKSSTTPKIKK